MAKDTVYYRDKLGRVGWEDRTGRFFSHKQPTLDNPSIAASTTADVKRRLMEIADGRSVTLSAIIKEAINEYLERHND
jgi:hypothetical protein